ncbi:flagellar basal body-associated FliL family protein [Sphingomonas sp. BIUV-7]|uniref:Flagellar protein FliL n=1 Tax=Sphingomonas natans TaxID=3063330 RepID=A0ABT8YDV0_9SPHN|nr:flagellar basal body-associated FliL family protein [Sphingomonas sp. BIUV-7]MDO6416528.1 flagellar basal body-associated FliL family protein [Sphingomonas sp. BIUV-7]
MSDAAEPKPKKKGGLVKKLVMFGVLPLVLIGGGAGAGLWAAGKTGGSAHEKKEDPNRPKLMLKSEDGHSAGAEGGHGEGGGEKSNISGGGGVPDTGPEPANPDPSQYQATFYSMDAPFTSNLADTDGFLQVGIGVSTFYDMKVIDNLKAADMPVRSAVLQVLAQQSAEALNTPQGKADLRKQLRDAINKTLKENEGFGGVGDVFFTSFIIQ